jgi:hypothetical protein
MHDPKTKPDGTKYCPLTLTVYDPQWESTKYTIIFTLQKEKQQPCCLFIQAEPPHVKKDYIQFKIMPIILYTAQISNKSIKQYRSLNAPFTKNYRKLLFIEKTPEAIIYLPNKYCDIGLPKVLELAQKYKWNNLLGCQALGQSPKDASINYLIKSHPGL